MEDIAPVLLNKIKADFNDIINSDKALSKLLKKVETGTATYKEANEYAITVGSALAKAYQNNISSDKLPDERMYYNIASRIIPPTMQDNYNMVARVTVQIQKSLNVAANIGIKVVIPKNNQDRIEKIVEKISSADNYDDVAWLLNDPIINYTQSIVDDFIKINSEFQGKAGLRPKIVRKVTGGCCKWCLEVSGTYTYPEVPKDVYRRHERCRCTVEYDPGSGKVQNVHSKQWRDKGEDDNIAYRKQLGYYRTGNMTSREYENYKRELSQVTGRKQITLSKSEYAHVMSEINSNMSEEDRKHAIVMKPIGNYVYTFINKGFDDYTIIKKEKIE